MAAALTASEHAALAAFCDTLAPGGPDAPSAADTGVAAAFAEIIVTRLPPPDARELRGFLRAAATRVGAFVLFGRATPFHALDAAARTRALRRLATSRLPAKRKAFQAVKRVALFLHYALVDEATGTNPTWPLVGYALPAARRAGADPAAAAAAPASPPMVDFPLLTASDDATRVDAVVVGSGAGGGVAAAALARAGFSVLVVEKGEARGAAAFSPREVEGNRDLYENGGLFSTRDLSVTLLAGATAGGGTTVNWMTSLDPPAPLLQEWEARGATGVTSEALQADLAAVKARLNVGTAESTLNGANRVLRDGAVARGFAEGPDWRLLPRNAVGCADRCQPCVFGCPFDAKQSTLVTYLADAAQARARFLFRATATRVLTERGMATGVDVARADGTTLRVHARVVVLAAGAVHTPALLLRSGVRAPRLGRVYLHPTTAVAGTFDRPVRMWEGPVQTVLVDRFKDLDGAGHGVRFEAAPGHPGLSASALPWASGAAHAADMRDLARTAALITLTRDRDPGRVTVDARGGAVVQYALSRRDAAHVTTGIQELARLLQAAGATRLATLHERGVRVDGAAGGRVAPSDVDAFVTAAARAGTRVNDLGLFSAHQMGSACIGADGAAVAGADGMVFDAPGVFVADASAFPSASGVNPMLTIMALATRTAAHAVAYLKQAR